jgi:hypothetical protein
MILEAHQIVGIRPQVFLPQLHYGVGHSSRTRIFQPHRFHRSEAQRIASAPGNLLDRQTALEVIQLLPITLLD